jgi:Zn-dependent metalloprotease
MINFKVRSVVFALLGVVACGAPPDDPNPDPGSPDDLTPELRLAVDASLDHLAANAAVFGLRGKDDVRLMRAFTDELDLTHTRFQQTIDGVPVFGGEGIVHLRRDRSISRVTDAFVHGIAVSTTPRLSSHDAISRALPPGTCETCLATPPAADLWALRHDGRDRLVWRVQLRLGEGTSRISLPVVFVDAHDGSIVWQYDNLQTGTGPSLYSGTLTFETTLNAGIYYMEDIPRKLGTFNMQGGVFARFTDADDVWDAAAQRAGIDATYGALKTYEYYKNVHGRDGLNGTGGPGGQLAIDGVTPLITSRVHYGTSYNNAFWDGSQMTYGDGDGVTFSPLVALDVAGHEMTHGVTQFTAGLVYSGESGALNESYSDVFGAMVERYARGDSDAVWQIGDEIYTPATPGDALRFMESPHQASNKGYTADDDPDHYSERYLGGSDNGGVHINSGIVNKTFYLLAMGGTHHLGGSMTGIGPDKAAAIWYKALTAYMTSSTNFARGARATYDAAVALYGADGPEAAAVVSAWTLTGVGVDFTPPQVALTAPTDGATIIAPTVIAASATDDTGVVSVQFLVDGAVVGTDNSSPFSYSWNTVAAGPGPHTLAAKAYDAVGNTAQSAAITVTVDNETIPPTIAITSPVEGATVAGTVTVATSATDNVAIAKVELYVDGAYSTSTTAAPYSLPWSTAPLANGAHTLAAKAYDTVGNSATSATVDVVTDNDKTAPTVAITSPAAGSTVGGTVAVDVDAADNVAVTRVELRVDGVLVGTDLAAPWQVAWDTTAAGNGAHSLVARAYDALNNSATSSAVAVTVFNPGAAAYDPVLKAPRCAADTSVCDTGTIVNGRASLGPEPNTPNTLGGTCLDDAGGSYHFDESLDRLRIYTTDGSPIGPGKTITIEATVYAWSGTTDFLDLYYTSTPTAPSWTLIGTFTPGSTGVRTISTTFTIPAGTQHAIRGQFRYNGSATSPCSATGYSDRDDLVFATSDIPDTTPPTTSITAPAAGAVVSGAVAVTTASTDNAGVTAVDLLVDGTVVATSTSAPWSFTWNSLAVANRSHTLQTRARDAAGNTGTSALISVTVDNGVGPAAYDPVLRAPRCAVGYDGCDTGTLVDGRAGLGPEPNASNTINGSCADGTAGIYHESSSIDRLRVFTSDGTPLAAGKAVVVEATVWNIANADEQDVIDFYSTTTPASPSWSYIGSVTPGPSQGLRVISRSFTLPSGSQVAVRANMRRTPVHGASKPSSCTAGQYNDHDDLVFTVGGP